MNNEKKELSVNLINGILQYLDTRPHREVRQLIDAIVNEVRQSENNSGGSGERAFEDLIEQCDQ